MTRYFSKDIRTRHPIARQWGWDMGCLDEFRMWFLFYHCKRRAVNNILLWNIVLERDIVYGKYEMREAMYVQENRKYPQNISFMRNQFFFIALMIVAWWRQMVT